MILVLLALAPAVAASAAARELLAVVGWWCCCRRCWWFHWLCCWWWCCCRCWWWAKGGDGVVVVRGGAASVPWVSVVVRGGLCNVGSGLRKDNPGFAGFGPQASPVTSAPEVVHHHHAHPSCNSGLYCDGHSARCACCHRTTQTQHVSRQSWKRTPRLHLKLFSKVS